MLEHNYIDRKRSKLIYEIGDAKELKKVIQQNTYKTDLQEAIYYYYKFLIDISNSTNDEYLLPLLQFNGRKREYEYYPDLLKGRVVFEHLVNSATHRWLDINVLGHNGNTKGRVSANILYYLGMKADYRGIFKGILLEELLDILQDLEIGYEKSAFLVKTYLTYLQLAEQQIEISEMELEADSISQYIEEETDKGKMFLKEGGVQYYYSSRYERSVSNRKRAIAIHGMACIACGFTFEDKYGEYGKNYIEIHHIQPLHTLEEAREIDPSTDLVPLCANCHRMVHRRYDAVLSIQQLKTIIKE